MSDLHVVANVVLAAEFFLFAIAIWFFPERRSKRTFFLAATAVVASAALLDVINVFHTRWFGHVSQIVFLGTLITVTFHYGFQQREDCAEFKDCGHDNDD